MFEFLNLLFVRVTPLRSDFYMLVETEGCYGFPGATEHLYRKKTVQGSFLRHPGKGNKDQQIAATKSALFPSACRTPSYWSNNGLWVVLGVTSRGAAELLAQHRGMSLAPSTETKPALTAGGAQVAPDAGNRPGKDAGVRGGRPAGRPASPSPPPHYRQSSSSPTTATPSERNNSEAVESGSLSSEDGDGHWAPAPEGNSLKLRDVAKRSHAGRANPAAARAAAAEDSPARAAPLRPHVWPAPRPRRTRYVAAPFRASRVAPPPACAAPVPVPPARRRPAASPSRPACVGPSASSAAGAPRRTVSVARVRRRR